MEAEIQDLREQIAAAIEEVERAPEVEAEGGEATMVALPPAAPETVIRGLKASLLVAESASGECQEAVPFSPLRPIIKKGEDELYFCCNHSPQHCRKIGG